MTLLWSSSSARIVSILVFLCILICGCTNKQEYSASSEAQELPLCEGTFDFTNRGSVSGDMLRGFSSAEADGRWTDGNEASFTCLLRGEERSPSRVRINTVGFVYGGHSQKVLVSINGSTPTEQRYDPSGQEKVIELPLPSSLAGRLYIDFLLLDAVSPKELGYNADPRKIAIRVRSIEFK
jgi:hypothetical protein